MKKLILGFGCLCLVVFASCTTVKTESNVSTMSRPSVTFQSLDRSEYKILGKVTGVGSTTIALGAAQGMTAKNPTQASLVGDTGEYGYLLNDNGNYDFPGADAAMKNAVYVMIGESEKLGGDAIIFVTTKRKTTDDGIAETTTVTVSGLAVKIL